MNGPVSPLFSGNPITVNARYLTQPMTGVQRYASELVKRLPAESFRLVSPSGTGLKGHAWEQLALPSQCRRSLLWSPCNTGPLRVANQVVTIHDTAFIDCPQNFSWLFRTWYKLLIPRLARRVQHILTVSTFSKQRIIALTRVDASRVSIIANGVSPSLSPVSKAQSQTTLEKYGLSKRFVLTLGSISPRKNLGGLLQAWQTCGRKFPDVELVVAGGSFEIYGANALDVSTPGVRFIGRVDDSELASLYSSALLFVFPSLYEGFGIPPVEAMACGCPVVCSSATAIPEAVGEAAVQFDPAQPSKIAEAIELVLEDQYLRECLIEAGLKQAAQSSWDRAANQLVNVLHSVSP